MDEFKSFYFRIPPVSRYFLTILFITAFIGTYIKKLHFIIYYFILDYGLIFKKFQIWRLITNLFFIGTFSSQFLMFILMSYFSFVPAEKNAIATRTYAVFIMMIFYLLCFLHIVNVLSFKIFGFPPGFSLAMQLFLSYIYIDSKREPQKTVTLYFIKMKNCYFPFALIALNIISGGGIYDNIIGILVGNTYFVLEDVLPISKNLHLLKTPKFLVDFLEKYYYNGQSRILFNNVGNHREDDRNQGFGFGNSGAVNRNRENRGETNNIGRGFTPFGGRGTTVG